MVGHQRDDQRYESELSRVMVEPIPENRLGFPRFERRRFRPAPRCDKTKRVVAIPMFEAMLRAKEFVRFVRTPCGACGNLITFEKPHHPRCRL